MRVELGVNDLSAVGASDGDGSWESDFDRGVNGGKHCLRAVLFALW